MKNVGPEQLPLARTEDLIVKEVDDEVLVYDLKTDQAHCLNKTAALVWRQCNGKNSIQEIARHLKLDSQRRVDEEMIWLAVDELRKFALLDRVPMKPSHLAGMNRRSLMRHIGLAAIAVPTIMSLAAPTAQAQGSCIAKGASCSPPGSPGGCCTGCACNGSGKCAGSC